MTERFRTSAWAMVFLLAASWAIVLLFAASWAAAQAPDAAYTLPSAVAPGETTDLRIVGKNLAGASAIWTSFPAAAELASGIEKNGQEAEHVTYRLAVEPDAPVGVGALRVATGQGVSSLRLLMIDDLPSIVDAAGRTRDDAQMLQLPIAVDGRCDAEQYDYYTFHATAGQRVSVEVVARRLGFALDPVIRLLDANGMELAYSDDDRSIGADARFSHQFQSDGQYYLELRDIRYAGGDDYRYRLRVGDFPLVSVPFPLGVRRGESTEVELAGPAVDRVASLHAAVGVDSTSDRLTLDAKFSEGQGSASVNLLISDLDEHVEVEPNDEPEKAVEVVFPAALNGRFEQAKDRDWYQFTAVKGQSISLIGRTRSLDSPCDLFLRLYDAAGGKLAEVEDSDGEEGVLRHTFAEDGVYRLMVEDLLRRGGPEHVYRIEIRPRTPGFELAVETDKADVPRGGVFTLKVTADRRDYDGPITLAVEGLSHDVRLRGETIEKDKKETVLRITVPGELPPGHLANVQVVGAAVIDEQPVRAVASARNALRNLFNGLRYPPAGLDEWIGVGVGPVFPDFFELAADADSVPFPRLVGATTFTVKVKRLNKFDGQIALSAEGLPAGVTAEVEPIAKGKDEAVVKLSGPALLSAGDYPLRLAGRATFQDQPQRAQLGSLTLRVVDPLEISVEPLGALSVGAKQRVKIRLTRHGAADSPVAVELKNLPSGVTAADALSIEPNQTEIEVELNAALGAAIGAFTDLTAVGTARIKDQDVVIRSAPATLEIVAAQP